ncbi:MAG: hypothetical protein HXS50_00845 [Theionarchaea archaeon]|nr:hypothetical protein [Theionarchaea archaeon]
MKYKDLLYIGMIGSILAVVGGLGAQGTASTSFTSGNFTQAFTGTDTGEMADSLEEVLPDIREGVEKGMPYAVLQFGGYVLFAFGFIGIWRLTKRGLVLAAAIAFALFAVVTLVAFIILPGAMENLVDFLRDAAENEEPSFFPMSLILLGGAGILSLVFQLGGCVAGGYENYRIGKELDHDFLRGSGMLLMVGAIAALIPFIGVYILLLAVLLTGIGFYLLATRISEEIGPGQSNSVTT